MRLDNPIGIPSSSSGSSSSATTNADNLAKHSHPSLFIPHLYQDLPPSADNNVVKSEHLSLYDNDLTNLNMNSKFGLMLPNPAPEVALTNEHRMPPPSAPAPVVQSTSNISPNKSKCFKFVFKFFLF